MIQVALPKGRLGEKAYEVLAAAGYELGTAARRMEQLYDELGGAR